MSRQPDVLRYAVPCTRTAVHGLGAADYLVITRPYGRIPTVWKWEIQRRLKPLGVHLYEFGFESEHSANLAGEKASADLLEGIRQEEERADGLAARASCKDAPRRLEGNKRAVRLSSECRATV